MDKIELAKRASKLPAHYQDRLNPDTYTDINRSVRVGEWGEAVAQLVAALHQTDTTITSDEHTELNELLTAMHRPTDHLDTLTVAD